MPAPLNLYVPVRDQSRKGGSHDSYRRRIKPFEENASPNANHYRLTDVGLGVLNISD